jgi:hypothetical protein
MADRIDGVANGLALTEGLPRHDPVSARYAHWPSGQRRDFHGSHRSTLWVVRFVTTFRVAVQAALQRLSVGPIDRFVPVPIP